MLMFYHLLLFPVAKPTAKFLDWCLRPETISLIREREFRALITKHVEAEEADVGHMEGVRTFNFLDLDNISVLGTGDPIDPRSIISLPVVRHRQALPKFSRSADDPFLRQVHASGMKWVIITDASGEPQLDLGAHHFLRDARLGDVLGRLRFQPQHTQDDVIDQDLALAWGNQKRIISPALNCSDGYCGESPPGSRKGGKRNDADNGHHPVSDRSHHGGGGRERPRAIRRCHCGPHQARKAAGREHLPRGSDVAA